MFRYEVGQYSYIPQLLEFFKNHTNNQQLANKALWGKLAAEILMVFYYYFFCLLFFVCYSRLSLFCLFVFLKIQTKKH